MRVERLKHIIVILLSCTHTADDGRLHEKYNNYNNIHYIIHNYMHIYTAFGTLPKKN